MFNTQTSSDSEESRGRSPATDVEFPHVSRQRLSQAITAEIEHLILEERLSPGDRLPSQQKLANQFGVSAPVVREAIQTLAARGLLDVRHGSGTYVRKPSLDILARTLKLHVRMNHTSIMPLHEVRTVLESELAALAAERATPDDLATLDAILVKQRKYLEDPAITNEADLDFHLQLALAAHNDIFLVLLNPLIELIREYRSVAIQYRTVNQASLEDHEAIYEAVCDGDSKRARSTMSTHLTRVKNLVLERLEQDGSTQT